MERKKRETAAFFKEMERNIFLTFERAKKREEADDYSEGMYEYNDNYDDNMDDMLRNSVGSYPDGENCSYSIFLFYIPVPIDFMKFVLLLK